MRWNSSLAVPTGRCQKQPNPWASFRFKSRTFKCSWMTAHN
uniref:Alternative protein MYH15 n=1 Tax=Homo sapiens TaxID=9606 RepID=L8E9Q8_HUMAN|nr:alternative protein MYH15 [Homo sapiens]